MGQVDGNVNPTYDGLLNPAMDSGLIFTAPTRPTSPPSNRPFNNDSANRI